MCSGSTGSAAPSARISCPAPRMNRPCGGVAGVVERVLVRAGSKARLGSWREGSRLSGGSAITPLNQRRAGRGELSRAGAWVGVHLRSQRVGDGTVVGAGPGRSENGRTNSAVLVRLGMRPGCADEPRARCHRRSVASTRAESRAGGQSAALRSVGHGTRIYHVLIHVRYAVSRPSKRWLATFSRSEPAGDRASGSQTALAAEPRRLHRQRRLTTGVSHRRGSANG